jgi:GxxExxY protein
LLVEEELTGRVIEAAIQVHKVLGPGMLESAYEACLDAELRHCGLPVRRQCKAAVSYRDVVIEDAYRIDLLVDDRLIVEVKSVKLVEPVHKAQLLTYLRFLKCRVGLLLNFNVARMSDGIVRVVN